MDDCNFVSYVKIIPDEQLNLYDLHLIQICHNIPFYCRDIWTLLYEYITVTGSVSFTPYNVSYTDKKKLLIYKE
jgi:hypothetical protein